MKLFSNRKTKKKKVWGQESIVFIKFYSLTDRVTSNVGYVFKHGGDTIKSVEKYKKKIEFK